MIRKFAAAIIPAAVTLLGALQVAIADGAVDQTEAGQLIALVAGVAVTYFVPLLSGAWAGGLKVGASLLAAVATLIVPLFTGFTTEALVVFVLALLNALGTELGVAARVAVPAKERATGTAQTPVFDPNVFR